MTAADISGNSKPVTVEIWNANISHELKTEQKNTEWTRTKNDEQ